MIKSIRGGDSDASQQPLPSAATAANLNKPGDSMLAGSGDGRDQIPDGQDTTGSSLYGGGHGLGTSV